MTDLDIQYDRERDLVTIDGIKFSGGIFRTFSELDVGRLMRIEKREDGVLTVRTFAPGEQVIA